MFDAGIDAVVNMTNPNDPSAQVVVGTFSGVLDLLAKLRCVSINSNKRKGVQKEAFRGMVLILAGITIV